MSEAITNISAPNNNKEKQKKCVRSIQITATCSRSLQQNARMTDILATLHSYKNRRISTVLETVALEVMNLVTSS